MAYNLKFVIWNVHGVNARARCLAIRSLIATSDASVVCLQETKMELISSSIVLEVLGPEFDGYLYLPAEGTRGGIVLAWKSRVVTISDPMLTTNILTARVAAPECTPWWISVVYGPQDDNDKITFLHEIREVRRDCPGPWMICGDFNLILHDEDKNNGLLDRRMMGRFRRCVNDLALKEVYLHGRRYTWS